LTLERSKDLEYLLILNKKGNLIIFIKPPSLFSEEEAKLGEEPMSNFNNGTCGESLGRKSNEERLKLAKEAQDHVRTFFEAEKPPLYIGDEVKVCVYAKSLIVSVFRAMIRKITSA
jgi:hypothetical protein